MKALSQGEETRSREKGADNLKFGTWGSEFRERSGGKGRKEPELHAGAITKSWVLLRRFHVFLY